MVQLKFELCQVHKMVDNIKDQEQLLFVEEQLLLQELENMFMLMVCGLLGRFLEVNRYIGLVCQKDANVEETAEDDLYKMGVIAEVIRVIELDENNFSIIVQSKKRFEWTKMTQTEPYFMSDYRIVETKKTDKNDKEYHAIIDSIRDSMNQTLHLLGDPPKELLQTINHESFTDMLVSYSATNLPIENREKQELLTINDEKEQAYRLLMILNRETQILELKMNIQMKTREDLNKQQKEYYLQQQIKTIQEELGGNTQQI